jgi:hypothetical protein
LENILDLDIFKPFACLLFVRNKLKYLFTCHHSIYILSNNKIISLTHSLARARAHTHTHV